MIIFAEGTVMTGIDAWLPLIGQGGMGIALVWYLYYTTAVVTPKREKEHCDRMDATIDKHNAVTERICSNFEACIREERQVRTEELKEIRNSMACRNFQRIQGNG